MTPLRTWTIGRSKGSDIVLTADGVADRHCRLAQHADGFTIEDLGTQAGTWVNGERLPVGEQRRVSAGDRIGVGLLEVLPWPEAEAAVPRTIRIGRAPDNDVVIEHDTVSWHHARLLTQPDGTLWLEDAGSTNGTFLETPEERVQRVKVVVDSQVLLGTLKVPVSRLLAETRAVGSASQGQVRFSGQEMLLGRDPAADCHLPYPMISWHHARLRRTARGIEVEDLGSRNGTFIDGVRVQGRVLLRPGSEVALGSYRFRLLDQQGTLDRRTFTNNVTVSAVDVTVDVGSGSARRALLEPVSLTVLPGELVALMGLAGAGKTTLLKALNGYTEPSAGRVLFNGEDLYEHRDQFRTQIGYVPQDDILHAQLTVREALSYTARLRTDLRANEIEARVTQVLVDLGIEDIGDRLIGSPEHKVISGGQRKRVSIGMELLSDPSVLFLDEPTSGLSSYDAAQVMSLLRRLADAGKTIICTIHQPSIDIFRMFDALIVVGRDKGDNPGMLVYFGPAWPSSVEFFRPAQNAARASEGSAEDVMTGLAGRPASEWKALYRQSGFHGDYVVRRAVTPPRLPDAGKHRSPWLNLSLGQLPMLVARGLKLKVRDRVQSAVLLAQAPLFALLVSIVFVGLGDRHFEDPAEWATFSGKISSVHFLMVVAAVWFGCNNAARDIVGETTVVQRERMVNLQLPPYVFSKVAVLALFSLVQCTTLLAIVYYACDLVGPFPAFLTILLASSLTGSALGLLISAVSRTTEAAIAFLPLVLLPFILLGGGIKPVHEMPALAQTFAAVAPTRWAFEASLLEEAGARRSTFTNAVESQLRECQRAAGKCGPHAPASASVAEPDPPRTDVAAAVFPVSEGRSTFGFSLRALGTQFAVAIVLVLSALSVRFQH